jgi:hypothetical protein
MLYMNKIESAFLWAGTDTVPGGKCKVNWDVVWRPWCPQYRALRLRWSWQEWKEPTKIWVDLGNPCNDTDMDLFYASTTIYLGNGVKTPFWTAPWINGCKPLDIAPRIYTISIRKKWNVKKALHNNAWISKINTKVEITFEHIRQYISLWVNLADVTLQEDIDDEISWNLTE